MSKPLLFSLTINDYGNLAVTAVHDGGKRKLLGAASTIDEFTKLVVENCITDADTVMCSSSLDFPDEYTENPEVIKLCNNLRRGKPLTD